MSALDDFNAWVDSTNLSAANKTAAKQRGATLALGATREVAAHMLFHIQAEMAAATGEELARLGIVQDLLEAIAVENPPTAVQLAALIVSLDNAKAWQTGLVALFMSKTVAQASALFDDLIARYGNPSARLTAFKNLLINKGY